MPGRLRRPAVRWERLPLARALPVARDWLEQGAAGLAPGTVDAYSRAVERYLAYCRQRRISPRGATTEHLAAYLRELAAGGLGPAARLQRLTAIRLFYAFVVERGLRPDNPAVASPHFGVRAAAPSIATGADGPDGPAPWVPAEDEWLAVLAAARGERLRSRVMLALAYDGALRREELCALRVVDVDPAGRVLRVPARTAPEGSAVAPVGGREVPLSAVVADHCAAYLRERRRGGGRDEGDPGGGALFLSESPRNRAAPLAVWGWAKVVRAVARRAGVARFTTHTPRHLRLTDLARAGRDAREIARFAGHGRPGMARRYLHLAQTRPGPPGDGASIQHQRGEQLERVLFGSRR